MRAQITLFMIVGIVILLAFGFVIYVSTKTVRKTVSPTEFNVQPVKDYISSCLELSAVNGLKILGKQSGHLFTSQGGITPDVAFSGSDFINYDNFVVPFTVVPPQGSIGELSSELPLYPFKTFPFVDDKKYFQGYYGLSRLPPLYKKTPDNKPVPNSIQESLESFVKKNIVECADFKSFKDRGFTFKLGVPEVSLILASDVDYFKGESFVTFILDWPVDVYLNNQHAFFNKFSVKVPVRLATVYFFVKSIVDNECEDVSFTPQSKGSFSVSSFKINSDSIVSINDSLSILDNEPFEFFIARKNRAPALWFIPEISKQFCVGDKIEINNNILKINDFPLELFASEPDENLVVFKTDKSVITNPPFEFKVSVSDAVLKDYQLVYLEVIECAS